ncbi:MAG: type I 3-dehydroquinate dehydratase [Deltaproteobacteria bacterium]|nr:MAG: type I 3-dehydroquinate dehydratase [Deltaproteobacteria bacterium]
MSQICVSVMVEAADRVLENMRRARDEGADLLEWRLDVTRDPELETVLPQSPLPIIATVRSVEQGGHFPGTRQEQLRLLIRAATSGSSYVDWEFRPEEPLPEELSVMRERVILSYHDFEKTPAEKELESLFDQMAASNTGVVKVVTLAQRIEDNISLLNLIKRGRNRGIEVVAFCLGPLGRISRLACLLMGGAFTYAALESGAEAAPGQLTLAEMRRLLELLK